MKYLMFQGDESSKKTGPETPICICEIDCFITKDEMKYLVCQKVPWAIEKTDPDTKGHIYGDIYVIDMSDDKATDLLGGFR